MRLLWIVGVALLAALSWSASVRADQYSCETVNRGAVAYVRAGLPVSMVESNRTCEIAVDGVIPVGRSDNFTGAMNGMMGIMFGGDDGSPLPDSMIRDLLAGPFGDQNDGDGGEWADAIGRALDPFEVEGVSDCIRRFVEIVNSNDAGNDYTSVTQVGDSGDSRLSCTGIPPADEGSDPGMVSVQGGLRISYKVREARFTLIIPVGFIQDARDGNGIFQ